MKQLDWVREYFSFTRKERIALLVLIVLIAGAWFLPSLFRTGSPPVYSSADTAWMSQARQLLVPETEKGAGSGRDYESDRPSYQQYHYDRPASSWNREQKGTLFPFDPNTIAAADWEKLGLREKTIGIILNYRNKGGRFHKPEDLKRIYGLFEDEYERLAPYVRIENPVEPEASIPSLENNEPSAKAYTPKRTVASIDINVADTSGWIALPGIGSKLAGRIVSFREKLGGFYSIEQVGETFGLQDSTFRKIKPLLKLAAANLRKININTGSKDELKQHPYIRWAIANAIVEYRNQHGLFSKPEDLKKVSLINDETYNKIAAYITL